MPRVYIILVNWNGWQDTIECLESVFRLDYADYSVIVCDNHSTDGSVEKIKAWANGQLNADAANPELETLTRPAVPKPIPFVETSILEVAGSNQKQPARLILIHAGSNLGFAGGNNIGLEYALSIGDLEFAWLLNNDTVVTPSALSEMILRMSERADSGLCGSTLLDYRNPDHVQALGGSTYNKWLARSGHIGRGISKEDVPDPAIVESKMRYVIGASMLVRKSFLMDVGLMNESYFLYFEEIDWATRGKGRYALAYAQKSVVYHKQGTSAGTSFERKSRSYTSEYYSSRGRLLYTRKYFPTAAPVVACSLLAGSLLRYAAGNTSGARAIFAGLKEALNHRS
jgi:GT2 family glycosyltransferase